MAAKILYYRAWFGKLTMQNITETSVRQKRALTK